MHSETQTIFSSPYRMGKHCWDWTPLTLSPSGGHHPGPTSPPHPYAPYAHPAPHSYWLYPASYPLSPTFKSSARVDFVLNFSSNLTPLRDIDRHCPSHGAKSRDLSLATWCLGADSSPESLGRASEEEDTMIMDGNDALSLATLSGEAQPFGLSLLSFDSYKLPCESMDDDGSQNKTCSLDEPAKCSNTSSVEPATAGERTPGSPGSASGQADARSTQVGDSLNTPASTATDTPLFFATTVTSIPDPVPITGMPFTSSI
ncbi:hypothetical protein HDE_02328 [Halotydeus destructor]|nr:hypothetical protein HDE_02328 [Halotydeus destructor]